MSAQATLYAVLTGDVVGSSKLEANQRRVLQEVMSSASEQVMTTFAEGIPFPPSRFRGDGWQLAVTVPHLSLRIGLFFRGLILAGMQAGRVDTRVAIGLGTVDFLPSATISSGDGEAFRLSGEALETLPRSTRMALRVSESCASPLTESLDVIVKLVDLQARGWTGQQARAVVGALLDLTQKSISQRWFEKRISQQAVAQHLDRAGWGTIDPAIRFYEDTLRQVAADCSV